MSNEGGRTCPFGVHVAQVWKKFDVHGCGALERTAGAILSAGTSPRQAARARTLRGDPTEQIAGGVHVQSSNGWKPPHQPLTSHPLEPLCLSSFFTLTSPRPRPRPPDDCTTSAALLWCAPCTTQHPRSLRQKMPRRLPQVPQVPQDTRTPSPTCRQPPMALNRCVWGSKNGIAQGIQHGCSEGTSLDKLAVARDVEV